MNWNMLFLYFFVIFLWGRGKKCYRNNIFACQNFLPLCFFEALYIVLSFDTQGKWVVLSPTGQYAKDKTNLTLSKMAAKCEGWGTKIQKSQIASVNFFLGQIFLNGTHKAT